MLLGNVKLSILNFYYVIFQNYIDNKHFPFAFVLEIYLNFSIVMFFSEDMFVGTEWPVRRWTSGNRFTEPEDVSSPLSKSTRHLLVPDQRYYYNRFGEEVNNFITNGHTKGKQKNRIKLYSRKDFK